MCLGWISMAERNLHTCMHLLIIIYRAICTWFFESAFEISICSARAPLAHKTLLEFMEKSYHNFVQFHQLADFYFLFFFSKVSRFFILVVEKFPAQLCWSLELHRRRQNNGRKTRNESASIRRQSNPKPNQKHTKTWSVMIVRAQTDSCVCTIRKFLEKYYNNKTQFYLTPFDACGCWCCCSCCRWFHSNYQLYWIVSFQTEKVTCRINIIWRNINSWKRFFFCQAFILLNSMQLTWIMNEILSFKWVLDWATERVFVC